MTDTFSHSKESDSGSDSEERLFRIVDGMIAEKRAGREPSLEQVENENPELAEEIRDLKSNGHAGTGRTRGVNHVSKIEMEIINYEKEF